MFGLFSNDLNKAKEVARIIHNILKASFIGSKFDNGNLNISFPNKFCDDDYIIGFIDIIFINVLIFEENLQHKSDDINFLIQASQELYKEVYGDEKLEYMMKKHENHFGQTQDKSPEYERGCFEGELLYCEAYNKSKKEQYKNEPKVIEAYNLLDTNLVDSITDGLAMVTVSSHIRKKYFNVHNKKQNNNTKKKAKKIKGNSSKIKNELEELKKMFDEELISKEVWIAKQKEIMGIK